MAIKKIVVKRCFDVCFSLTGLIFLIPLFIIISILNKSTTIGPIFFKQKRVGKNGKLFVIYKFRSMYVNSSCSSSITTKNDSRITPIGRILRKYKLDELPELWNVLKGDMSFVGPRPDVPGYVEKLNGQDAKIQLLKPGITGPATLKYIDEEELLSKVEDPKKYNDEVIFPNKVKINLDYYYNNNIFNDIVIIVKTIF